MAGGDIRWLDPISLDFEAARAGDEKRFLGALRKQMREGIRKQGFDLSAVGRCVYVIRMTGRFLVAYETGNSPVLYVGRGNAKQRLASHLGRWLHYVDTFGTGTKVEIRVLVPARRNRSNYFKNVEADLISKFEKRHDSLPFFNRRIEKKFSGKVKYSVTQEKNLGRLVGIGSGKRPHWAIKPTPANRDFSTYLRGANPA
jgi:hypothetical protein